MLADVFYWLVNMSIAASLAGGVLLLLHLPKRLPRRFLFPLWSLVLLRLYIPFGPASRFSILQLLPHRTVTIPVTGMSPLPADSFFVGTNCVQSAIQYFPIVHINPEVHFAFHISAAIWCIVAAALLVILLLSYIYEVQDARGAAHLSADLYTSCAVTGPIVCGILRPRILLPKNWEHPQSELILQHERAHIRRRDNLWRLLALVTACLHWFNPLIWLFLRCFYIDLEQSCDEAVLRRCTADQRAAYAHALLDQEEQRALLHSPFGHSATPARIRNILSYRRLSVAATVFLALAAASISIILLTNTR